MTTLVMSLVPVNCVKSNEIFTGTPVCRLMLVEPASTDCNIEKPPKTIATLEPIPLKLVFPNN